MVLLVWGNERSALDRGKGMTLTEEDWHRIIMWIINYMPKKNIKVTPTQFMLSYLLIKNGYITLTSARKWWKKINESPTA